MTTYPYQHLLQLAQQHPEHLFLRQIINRKFNDYSFYQVVDEAKKLASALNALGLQPGDKIALISKNCAEWFIADLAMVLGHYISVPIFPTATADTIRYILAHSEAKAIFIGKLDDVSALKTSIENNTNLLTIAFSFPLDMVCQHYCQTLLQQYPPLAHIPSHQEQDTMSIVYTSGTSGTPKGAILTYGQYAWSVKKIIDVIQITAKDRLFSYLPLAHITERVYVMGVALAVGACTAFPQSLDTFIDDVKMQRPTLFISVPRLWALFQQKIWQKIPEKRLQLLIRIPLISMIIKKKIALNLGLDQARVLGCGSAPISASILNWYHRLGLDITEAWGMTESFAYGTLNYPFRADKIGSVGMAAPDVNIKLSSSNEILLQSQGMFAGYYKDPESTAQTLINNWLHTGDLGRLDQDGYLSIEGRINDTFKTAKGKFVCPVPIEKRLYELTKMEMLCLIGSGMTAPILLALAKNYPHFDRERYEKQLHLIIKTINQELETHAKIRGVLLIQRPWAIENGMLTPTLKIKRHLLEKKYHQLGVNWPESKLIIWEDTLE